MATLIDGRALAAEIREEIKAETAKLHAEHQITPHLVTVLVGAHTASKVYVGNKMRSCEKVGFKATLLERPSDISEQALLELVQQLNEDDDVDGFIVQLPLPAHIDEQKVTLAIDPKKDVDGFHPTNFGLFAQGLDGFIPATPKGILEMLARHDIETSGKHCVVVGRSNIVGTPISILLSRKAKYGNATVTLTHSRTQNLAEEVRRADIVIAAIGKANFVTADMVKEGAVIIDVGINRVEDASRKRGYRVVGDVDFEAVKEKASFITPVPGGVGQLTVTSLLQNTLKAAKRKIK